MLHSYYIVVSSLGLKGLYLSKVHCSSWMDAERR